MIVKKDGKAKRGSQKWLQILVNEKPELIDVEICKKLKIEKLVNSREYVRNW